eukprot:gene12355-15533_t
MCLDEYDRVVGLLEATLIEFVTPHTRLADAGHPGPPAGETSTWPYRNLEPPGTTFTTGLGLADASGHLSPHTLTGTQLASMIHSNRVSRMHSSGKLSAGGATPTRLHPRGLVCMRAIAYSSAAAAAKSGSVIADATSTIADASARPQSMLSQALDKVQEKMNTGDLDIPVIRDTVYVNTGDLNIPVIRDTVYVNTGDLNIPVIRDTVYVNTGDLNILVIRDTVYVNTGDLNVPNTGDLNVPVINLDSIDLEQQKANLQAAAEQILQRQQVASKNFAEALGIPTALPVASKNFAEALGIPTALPEISLPDLNNAQLPNMNNFKDGAVDMAGQAGVSLLSSLDSLQAASLNDVTNAAWAPGGALFAINSVVGGAWSSVSSNFAVFGDNWSLNIFFFAAIIGITYSLVTAPKY